MAALAPGLLARPAPSLWLRGFAEADDHGAFLMRLALVLVVFVPANASVSLCFDVVGASSALLVRAVVVVLLISWTVREGVYKTLQFWVDACGSYSEDTFTAVTVADRRCSAVRRMGMSRFGGVGDRCHRTRMSPVGVE